MKFFKIMRRSCMVVAAVAMLTANMSWAGIVNNLPTIRVNGQIMYYYDTQSGDNIYTVADKLGVSVEDIRTANPSVSDGIKPRMRLFFPTDIQTTETGSSSMPLTHIVTKGESIYGIARQYGMTMDELLALNPAASDGIKIGMRLNLAQTAATSNAATTATQTTAKATTTETATATVSEPKTEAPVIESTPETEPDVAAAPEIIETPAAQAEVRTLNRDSLLYTTAEEPVVQKEKNIAIILPFLLQEQTMGRQTKLYTEFYKGFLLAADTLNRAGRTPIKIHAYDSSANLDTVKTVMSRPEIANMDLIIASDNSAQLQAIAENAPEKALILNLFAVKDSSYTTLPNMIQTNIPHDEMYAQAIEGFLSSFPTATPVFLTRNDGKKDKEEFTSALKERLKDEGRYYQTITFDGYLSDSNLEELTPDIISYVFIPNSGSRDEFTRIVHALKTLKGKALSTSDVQLFGYPEWATFRGDQFDDICDLETTIYSRYFPIQNDSDATELNAKFRQTYGESMLDKQMPVLGILGYDTGKLVIEGLRTMTGTGQFPTNFLGIQSGINLERTDENSGWFNNALFIINYKPGGYIEKNLR
jgi:LysM repeat protein